MNEGRKEEWRERERERFTFHLFLQWHQPIVAVLFCIIEFVALVM